MRDRLTAGEAAEECGVSRQTIQTWYNEGLDRKPTRQQLMYFLAHRQGYAPGSERERLARAQAEKFELENARRRGEMTLVSYIAELLNGMAADIGGRLDGLAGRLANELAGITDPAIIRERILGECRAIRSGVAEHVGKLAESPPPSDDSSEDLGTTAAKKRKRMGRSKPRAAARKRRARSVEE